MKSSTNSSIQMSECMNVKVTFNWLFDCWPRSMATKEIKREFFLQKQDAVSAKSNDSNMHCEQWSDYAKRFQNPGINAINGLNYIPK